MILHPVNGCTLVARIHLSFAPSPHSGGVPGSLSCRQAPHLALRRALAVVEVFVRLTVSLLALAGVGGRAAEIEGIAVAEERLAGLQDMWFVGTAIEVVEEELERRKKELERIQSELAHASEVAQA